MKFFRFGHRRMIAASLCAATISVFSASSGSAQNIFPTNGPAGIGTANPNALLHLFAIDGFPQRPSILFGYGVDFGGEIGNANVDAVPSTLVKRGDYFLRTVSRSNDIVLTNQTSGGKIKFGTSLSNGITSIERESFTISSVQDAISQKGHTQLDIHTAAPNEGNAVLRFYSGAMAQPAPDMTPWIVGMDIHHSFSTLYSSNPTPPPPGSVFRIGLNSSIASPAFSNDNYNFLTILRDGRVIIGKPLSPTGSSSSLFSSKLSVNGRIVANELVCVDIGSWADFVFADDYKLPSLAEVEQHIQQNKHLPDIPSASEVQQKGVNVVEMQTKLLQKVEELTLYMIEQNKQISEQNARIKSLEAELLQKSQKTQTTGNN